jgi:2-oxoisovalerate dehydrogenase E1 component alpha subunit
MAARSVTKGAPRKTASVLGLNDEQLTDIYYKLLLSRTVSARMRLLQRMGKGSITYSAEGHEAAQVGTAYALRPGTDWLYTYYRDTGVAITIGMAPLDVFMAFFARRDDINSGGRNMPNHFSSKTLRIVSQGAPVATQVPQAVGTALACKLRGLDELTTVYFGDGATSVGDVHEAMNFAGIHDLPVIFVCEHNNYAISVPWRRQAAVRDVGIRARGYGFPGVTVDGNDFFAVHAAMKEAVERARSGGGPTFLEAKTYRIVPHSSDDDDRRYRTREEVEKWMGRDPVAAFAARLDDLGVLDEDGRTEIEQRVIGEVEEAIERAESAPVPDQATALDHVLVEGKRS